MTGGAYLANAAGCETCHTDKEHGGRRYAGGRALTTPFGIYYSPNITPDPETGIGRWTDAQFLTALHEDLVTAVFSDTAGERWATIEHRQHSLPQIQAAGGDPLQQPIANLAVLGGSLVIAQDHFCARLRFGRRAPRLCRRC